MKISIIVPTFNVEKIIGSCLNSICRQTYRDFEVVIADGASSDNTVKIAKSISKKIPKMQIISERDRGIYDAMNKAVALAKGSWIYFLGSDDTLYEDSVLEKLAPWLDEEKYHVVYGDISSPRFGGKYGGEFSKTRILFENISHQAIFLHKEIFRKLGPFDLNYKAQADWDHNMRWLLNTSIRSKYIQLTIANYADGGFSSLHGDTEFEKIRLLNYLQYASTSVPTLTKTRAYLTYQKGKLKTKRYQEFFCNLKYIPLLFARNARTDRRLFR